MLWQSSASPISRCRRPRSASGATFTKAGMGLAPRQPDKPVVALSACGFFQPWETIDSELSLGMVRSVRRTSVIPCPHLQRSAAAGLSGTDDTGYFLPHCLVLATLSG